MLFQLQRAQRSEHKDSGRAQQGGQPFECPGRARVYLKWLQTQHSPIKFSQGRALLAHFAQACHRLSIPGKLILPALGVIARP